MYTKSELKAMAKQTLIKYHYNPIMNTFWVDVENQSLFISATNDSKEGAILFEFYVSYNSNWATETMLSANFKHDSSDVSYMFFNN